MGRPPQLAIESGGLEIRRKLLMQHFLVHYTCKHHFVFIFAASSYFGFHLRVCVFLR